jgi:hypothetical protein
VHGFTAGGRGASVCSCATASPVQSNASPLCSHFVPCATSDLERHRLSSKGSHISLACGCQRHELGSRGLCVQPTAPLAAAAPPVSALVGVGKRYLLRWYASLGVIPRAGAASCSYRGPSATRVAATLAGGIPLAPHSCCFLSVCRSCCHSCSTDPVRSLCPPLPAIYLQGIDLKSGGRYIGHKNRTAPASQNVYIKLLEKVRERATPPRLLHRRPLARRRRDATRCSSIASSYPGWRCRHPPPSATVSSTTRTMLDASPPRLPCPGVPVP